MTKINSFNKLAIKAFFIFCFIEILLFIVFRDLIHLAIGFNDVTIFFAIQGVVLSASSLYLSRIIMHIGCYRYVVVGVIVFISFFAAKTWSYSDISIQPSMRAVFTYSDSSNEKVSPNPITSWGREFNGFSMHPAFADARVPNTISVEFTSPPPEALEVVFAKPAEALFGVGNQLLESDGIEVNITVTPITGTVYMNSFEISNDQFLNNKWITKSIREASGITRLMVMIKPRNTPDYDTTYVAIVSDLTQERFVRILMRTLYVYAILSLILCFFIYMPSDLIQSISHQIHYVISRLNANLVFSLTLLFITYYTAQRTIFVYFYDYRNYWEKTENLQQLIQQQSWAEVWNAVARSYISDYSMLPALLPAVFGSILGINTRLAFNLIICMIYAAPAYLILFKISKRIVSNRLPNNLSTDFRSISFFCVLTGLPLYFGTVHYLMPDIGGVVIFSIALLSADTLLSIIISPNNQKQSVLSKDLFWYTLVVSISVSLMFIFRRWYAFASVALVISMSCYIFWILLQAEKEKKNLLIRLACVSFIGIFVIALILAPVIIEWVENLDKHRYAAMYSAYKDTFYSNIFRFTIQFGLVVPMLCIVGIIVDIKVYGISRLWILLVFSNVFGFLMFLYVQSPARQHYYLLMPLLSSGFYVFSYHVIRRSGILGGLILVVAIFMGNVISMSLNEQSIWRRYFFPGYADWVPKTQPYLASYQKIGQFLNENVLSKRLCVIASGVSINESIVYELWQIMPNIDRNLWRMRFIRLGQVDTVDGPPSKAVRECEIAVVATPFQTHLKPGAQYSLEIIQQDLVTNTGIGVAWQQLPQIFDFGHEITVALYRRIRPINDSEYSNLIARYYEFKKRSSNVTEQLF